MNNLNNKPKGKVILVFVQQTDIGFDILNAIVTHLKVFTLNEHYTLRPIQVWGRMLFHGL